jgi:hypothetical protein|nr:MAG TPA: virulence protein RhuM family [Caudoviricetes sp.]
MIIAVVFKVNSKRANQFRKWADGIVKEYTIDCILDKGKMFPFKSLILRSFSPISYVHQMLKMC